MNVKAWGGAFIAGIIVWLFAAVIMNGLIPILVELLSASLLAWIASIVVGLFAFLWMLNDAYHFYQR